MINRKLQFTTIVLTLATILTACTSLKKDMITDMDNKKEIGISVTGEVTQVERNKLDWIELDQLEINKEIRKTWDDTLNIVRFDTGSKNGSIFVDLKGNWSGNNTIYNSFQNKVFVKEYWNETNIRSKLAQSAMNTWKDIDNENTGIVASVNGYFNILPSNSDGTSGMLNNLSRAEVMSAIYRADTPVGYLEVNNNFKNAVGENELNVYAQNLTKESFLDYSNGALNNINYNQVMTRAEAVYIIVQRYFTDEYNAFDGKVSLSDCKDAGEVAIKNKFTDKYAWQAYELEFCLKNSKNGVTTKLYNALGTAKQLGIIDSTTQWDRPISAGSLMNMLIKSYNIINTRDDFLVSAKIGGNAGKSLVIKEEPVESVAAEKIRNIANIDDLIDEYGDEIDLTDEELEEAKKAAEGFTIEACDKYMIVDYCYHLNVRVGPSTDDRIIKSVPVGTKVHIVGKCAENGWYRVIADGKISYQCGVYFSDLEGEDTTDLIQEYE